LEITDTTSGAVRRAEHIGADGGEARADDGDREQPGAGYLDGDLLEVGGAGVIFSAYAEEDYVAVFDALCFVAPSLTGFGFDARGVRAVFLGEEPEAVLVVLHSTVVLLYTILVRRSVQRTVVRLPRTTEAGFVGEVLEACVWGVALVKEAVVDDGASHLVIVGGGTATSTSAGAEVSTAVVGDYDVRALGY